MVLFSSCMKDSEIEKVLKALANKRRLAILKFIKKRKQANVSEIAGEIKLSFRSTSRHLRVLVSANILDREQIILQGIYRFDNNMPSLTLKMVSVLV